MVTAPLRTVAQATGRVLLLGGVVSAAGCSWAPPVNPAVRIPRGISASFSPDQIATSEAFADLFCSVLAEEFADWGACGAYLRLTAAPATVRLDPIPKDRTLLIVPGYGAGCFESMAPTFGDASAHLDAAHGMRSVMQ